MNYRVKNIVIAVALAALAAVVTMVYVVNYKRHVQNGEGKVTVLVASRDIPAGTSGTDIVDRNMLKEQTVPRKAVVAGAISSSDQLARYVATQDVYEGEQVTTRRFALPSEQGVRALMKGTQRAYELPGDPKQLLAGTVEKGDYVDVVGAWEVNDTVVSRVVLRNILVLRSPSEDSSGGGVSSSSDGSGSVSVQLRVTDAQAQKLLYIQKNGVGGDGKGYWLTLRSPTKALDSANTIQTAKTMLFDGPGRGQ